MIIDVFNLKNSIKNIHDVYHEVSKQLHGINLIEDIDGFTAELKEREEMGVIKIYEDIYLPHLLTSNIKETSIIRVDNFEDKILFILVNENQVEHKDKVQRIVSSLLEKNYADNLFSLEASMFKEEIKNI